MQSEFAFETARLQIKALSEEDFDKIYQVQTDPEVMRYIGSGLPRSKEQIQELFEKMVVHQETYGYSLCPVYERETGLFIGCAGLIHLAFDDTQPEIEVGYWLLPQFWGKGYATETTKACVQWAFAHLSVNCVVGITQLDHIRSQRVLEKAGLQSEGRSTYRGHEVLKFVIKR